MPVRGPRDIQQETVQGYGAAEGIANYSRLKKDQLVELVKKSLADAEDEIKVQDKRVALGGVFGTVTTEPMKQHDVETFMQVSRGTI